ncbi:Uncharacterised protein [Serratia fonticola]|uniref:hypothetical protein n=1 Tax=Serratia fonticola TaxID=47917 RepID=UPI0021775D5E|nr:hypothetical protein [Serratia fonticola]CAI1222094.1 Uncharacterised protein [Serratia fonticola]CAI2497167.1 Uncharacterised protein [Serratia fonticola]
MITSIVKIHKPKRKSYIKKIGSASIISLFTIPMWVEASMILDFQNYQSYVTLSGSILVSDLDPVRTCAGESYGYCYASRPPSSWFQAFFSKPPFGKTIDYAEVPPTCDRHYRGAGDNVVPAALSREDRVSIVNFFNNYYSTPRRLLPNAIPPEPNTGYKISASSLRLVCRDPQSGESVSVYTVTEYGEVVNPPTEVGVCSLNNQNVNLNYSATNLNVNGMTKSEVLSISCSQGIARDYTLKLTGSNVIDGRINLGGGVSAQISLNDISVKANGAGISLNGLTSRTIPVSATLVGTATSPGVSNANGILVLEAL